MAVITEHELVVNEQGQLALLLAPINEEVTAVPTLLVVRDKAKAYLNLGSDDSHEITGLAPNDVEKLCATQNLLVVEIEGQDVVRTYDTAVGPFDEDEEDEAGETE